MEQAQKQRPCVVIGTYGSCRIQQHQLSQILDHQQQVDVDEIDCEQSTDLFSYCRASQLNLNLRWNPHQNYSQRNQPTKLKLKLSLNQIKGPSGSVRGHKDVVRKSLENIRAVASISGKRNFCSPSHQLRSFKSSCLSHMKQDATSLGGSSSAPMGGPQRFVMQMDEQHKLEYLERLSEDELGQCVAYTTTLGVIRRTFEDCKLMRSILNLNLIKYEERDIYLNQEYKKQLRLRSDTIQVPVLFVDGKYFGGIKEVELMNEDGNLIIQLARFKMSEAPKHVCYCCGNAKFIACQSCNGSRKSAVHHFKYNSIALRCIRCDKNDGLVDCPVCSLSKLNDDTLATNENRPREANKLPTTDGNNNDDDQISSV